jgi:hypothetical protein
MKAVCLQCHTSLSNYQTLSLGKLPVCNRLEKHPTTRVGKHALSISECAACNLVQLSKFSKAKFVRPRIPCIKYNEPMAHLGYVIQRLLKLLPKQLFSENSIQQIKPHLNNNLDDQLHEVLIVRTFAIRALEIKAI